LNWDQVDLENREILLTTRKTSRNQKIPMTAPLVEHVKSLKKPKLQTCAVHPKAEAMYASQGRTGTLSRQFYELMAKAGIVEKKEHGKTVKAPGRNGRRSASRISFHSLRHTTTSLLKNAGVSPAIAEEFVGHDSAEMNRVYTHIELNSMRKAAALLPDVLA
jgi:integrase